jgi:hypothetical protein
VADRVLWRDDLNRATLARQLLLERAELPVPEAVERVGGLQAQEPRPPFVGLWTRLAGFDADALRRALHERSVVRGTLARGTLHLDTPAGYAALRPTLAPVLRKGLRMLGDRAAGLDEDAVVATATELLEEEPRTFGELRALLQERFPDVNDRALGFCVRMLLPLVMVPTDDRWGFPRDARFTPADRWLKGPRRGAPKADPAALVRRHLAAFGPATVADIQSWSGLGGLRATVDGLRDELEVFADERGRELFDLPDAPRPAADDTPPPPPRLLPGFDSVLLAHDDRARIVDDAHRGEVVTKNLRVRATFLVDGRVAGTWTTEVARGTARLTLTPFAKLRARDRKALAAEAEPLLALLEPDARGHELNIA